MNWFSHNKSRSKLETTNKVETRFQTVVDLVRDLNAEELSRLLKAVKLCWQGYREVEQARPSEEKEYGEIDLMEESLERESGRDS